MLKLSHSLLPQLRLTQTTTSCISKSDSVLTLRPTDKCVDPQNAEHLFVSDEHCRERLVARAISTLNQLIQPRHTSGMVKVFTTAIIDEVEKGVPSPPYRHHRHGWCESADTLAVFMLAWTAREDARQLLRPHPRDRTAWKTLRFACALRSKPRRNRTTSSERRPERLLQTS